MKTISKRQIEALCALVLVCPVFGHAQRATTQEIYGGVSYVRTDDHPSVNALGWEASYSEYPYASFPWFGGSIEASGVYAHPAVSVIGHEINGLLNNRIYTFMGGPVFTTHSLRSLPRFTHVPPFQPFAHLLLGGVLTQVDTTGEGTIYFGETKPDSQTAFGLAIGGGVDFHVKKAIAVRASADWLRSSFHDQNIDRQNNLRTSIGIVLKF